jgi:hypothetical protein
VGWRVVHWLAMHMLQPYQDLGSSDCGGLFGSLWVVLSPSLPHWNGRVRAYPAIICYKRPRIGCYLCLPECEMDTARAGDVASRAARCFGAFFIVYPVLHSAYCQYSLAVSLIGFCCCAVSGACLEPSSRTLETCGQQAWPSPACCVLVLLGMWSLSTVHNHC